MSAKRATKAPEVFAAIAASMPLTPTVYATNEKPCDDGYLFLLDLEICGDVERAIAAALKASNPRVAKRIEALSDVFDEQWNEIELALREAAFLVGVEYGQRLGGRAGGSDDDPPAQS